MKKALLPPAWPTPCERARQSTSLGDGGEYGPRKLVPLPYDPKEGHPFGLPLYRREGRSRCPEPQSETELPAVEP